MHNFPSRKDGLNSRRAGAAVAARSRRSRRLDALERLEDRTVPTVLLDFDPMVSGSLIYREQNQGVVNNLTVSTTGPAGNYSVRDTGSPIVLSPGAVAAGFTVTGDTATGPDSAVKAILIDTNDANDLIDIESIDANTSISPDNNVPSPPPGSIGTETVTVGKNSGTLANIHSPLSVFNNFGQTDLSLSDQNDTAAGQTVGISNTTLTRSSSPTSNILYQPVHVRSLSFSGPSTGSTYNISSTPAATVLNTGATTPGANAVNVLGTANPLTINDQGNDVVNVGSAGLLTNVTSPVTLTGTPSVLSVDDRNDATGRNLTLGETGGVATLAGFTGTVSYTPAQTQSLTVDSGTGTNSLSVSFLGGNLIPTAPSMAGPGGITYTGGGGPNTLNLTDGAGLFTTETYNAQGPGAGSIAFDTPTSTAAIMFSGLKPVNDTVPLPSYTFVPPASAGQVVTVADGPIFGGFQTLTIRDGSGATPPAFELANIANKGAVTINETGGGSGPTLDQQVNLTNTTAAAGETALTINTGNGNDNVNVTGTPAGVATTVSTGSGNDTVSVVAAKLGAGTVLVLDGGTGGNDILNVDTTGETSFNTSTPGLIAFVPSTATIRYTGFEQVNVNNSPIAVSPAPAALSAVEGQPLNNVTVATFTDTSLTAPASSFTATIDWGDGSPRSSGLITQAGGAGTTFTVTGTHTYAESSATPYRVIVTVTDSHGNNATAISSASVADAALTNGVGLPVSAVEGQAVNNVGVATFTDANPLATVSDFNATVTFNDGTTSPGTVTEVGGTATGSNFLVSASHLFTTAGSFPVAVTVADSGGQSLTIAPAGTANVAAAPLTALGATITGIEGNPATGLVATFTDANPAATAGSFSATINYGDGTTTTGTVTRIGTANGTLFQVVGDHTYAENGTYPVSVTIASASDARAVASGVAVIADAPLAPAATQPAATTTEGQSFTGPVASFIDANPAGPVSDFRALVYFGDGTAPTVGTVSQPGGVGTPFVVSATHTVADSGVNGGVGAVPVSVFINDVGGASVNLTNTLSVRDVPIVVTGRLSPASDSGLSSSDGITKVIQPDFFGTSEPGSTVRLFASVRGVSGFTPVQIGAGVTAAGGNWNIVSQPLFDGVFDVTVAATDASGHTTGSGVIQTGSNGGPLVIDTVGPKVTDVLFGRLTGQILVTFQDNLSGLDPFSLRDASNYTLTKQKAGSQSFLVNSLVVSPGGAPTAPKGVLVTFNTGKSIRGGNFTFTVHSGGIRDVAGNALDGEFFGTFPSGNNVPGGDFVAHLKAIHRRVFAPQSVVGNANPTGRAGRTPGTSFIGVGTGTRAGGRNRIATASVHTKAPAAVHHTAQLHAHDAALAQVHASRRRHA